MKLAIAQKVNEGDLDDYTLWAVEVSPADFKSLTQKYGDSGYSVRGTKEDILEELSELI